MAYTKFQEQAIYQAIQDLAEWLVPHVGKWNKWLRPTLGHQTLECVLNILRTATTAYASPRGKKLPYLERASAELDSLRSWFAHLSHANTYSLRTSLRNEAKSTLMEYLS
jgi:hypothetical protein